MINIPYRASTYIGRRNRRRFVERLSKLPCIKPADAVPATVYSLSCESDWPEEAACIRSFLKFVGMPERFIVVSDGSHSRESRYNLEKISPCVSVRTIESLIRPDLPERVRRYAAQHFLGKKLSLFLSMPVNGPTVYTDSDILFFPGATALANLLRSGQSCPLYLLDSYPSLDDRLLSGPLEKEEPVNGGFLVFNRPLDWSDALARLERLEGDCVFFTEQTLVHLAVKASSGKPLPPDQFVLRAEDQFVFEDRYARQQIALRHYISSIRTKLWHHTAVFC